MPERKYTYKVEIDAAQAKATAEALRRQLMDALSDIGAPGSGGGLAAAVQEAQKPVEALKRQLADVAKIDLTKGTDELLAQLDKVQREITRTRNEYERMGMTAAAQSGPSARSRANQRTYVDEVRKAAGDDAAESARRLGRAINIGQAGAQFKADDAGVYGEAERDALRAGEANNEKRRFNAAEKRALAELEAQLLASELDALRIQKEVTQRQAQEAEQRSSRLLDAALEAGTGIGAAEAQALQEAERLAQETKELAEQEQQMLEGVANANQRLSTLIEQQDNDMRRAAAKAQGQIVAATAGNATAHTSQAAITVSAGSVANAEKLAQALREAAEATERIERSRMSTNVRGFELDLERERARIQKDARLQTVAEEGKLRDAQRTAREQENQQKRLTAATEREARKRASAEAKAARDAEKATERATRQQEADQRRLTAATEREARRRAVAERTARTGGSFSLSGAWNRLDMMAGMAAGGLAAFGVAQVGQQVYGAGEAGARLERQAATFREFAARMGEDATRIVQAVQGASNGTITEFDAMSLASQVLASKFSQSSTDITGDMATVVAASRRFSQIFTDENGQAMGTQEIFSRLIKFAREGNKELVDQFGLSNQLIADAMGTTVDGLASAQGATLRWQGLVKVLNGELERLGTAATTTAEKYEQSAARMADAKQRLQMAIAEPLAAVGEGAAGVAEGAVTMFGAMPIDRLRGMVATERQTSGLPIDASAYDKARAALRAYDAAMKKNAATAVTYSESLRVLLSALVNQGTLSIENTRDLSAVARQLDLVAKGTDAYSVTMRTVSMEAIKHNAQMLEMAVKMANLEQQYIQGEITGTQYGIMVSNLAIKLGNLAGAAGIVGPLLEGVTRAMGGVTDAMPGFLDMENLWPTPAGMTDRQVAAMAELNQWRQQQAEKRKAEAIANEPYTAAGQDKLRQNLVLDLQKQAAADERAAAADAQREWESAAKKTAAEFEAAAEKAAAAFESALRAVPGLFGTSEVTDEQMKAAAAGVPQEFADNYLRRLADEVGGGIDYEGIDIQDAARRAGVDGSLPKEIILDQVRSAWQDSSLFAGGKNLDLITEFGGLDAIKANLARQEAGASGQQSLIDFLAGQGLGPAAISTGADGTTPAGLPTPEQAPDMALETVDAIKQAFGTDRIAGDLRAVGENTLAMIHAGYRTGAMNADWTGPIVDAVVSQLAGQLAGMMDDAAPPP